MTPAAIAGLVAAVVGLVKVVELLITAYINKDKPVLTSEDILMLRDTSRWTSELYNMHNKFDNDGTPIWYVPRSWGDTQSKMLDQIGAVAHSQEKLGMTMERIVQLLDRIDRRKVHDGKD